MGVTTAEGTGPAGHDPLGLLRHLRIVGDHDNSGTIFMELPEQFHDLCAAGRIQGAGGFVRQQQLGAAHHGPCNCQPLSQAA